MAKQEIKFGTPPQGIGGDSYRTAFGKCNENFNELYTLYGIGWGHSDGTVQPSLSAVDLDNSAKWRSGVFKYSDPALPGGYGYVLRLGTGTSGAVGGWFTDVAYTTGGAVHIRVRTNASAWSPWVQQANVGSNVASATVLQTARLIGGVPFNGSANIDLPGVNKVGNQNTTGSAATLTTARTITVGRTGKTFNGSANVSYSVSEILPTAANGQFLKYNGTDWVASADNNTTYSAMTSAEAVAGSAVTARLITPATLKEAITTHSPTPAVFSTDVAGLVPARVGTTTTKFLREDGTWVVPTNTTYSGMSASEISEGTATTNRLISPANLKTAIQTHAPVGGQFLGNQEVKAIAYNAQNISEDVTIPGHLNAMSAGPITIDDGKTVTISDGATWTIV